MESAAVIDDNSHLEDQIKNKSDHVKEIKDNDDFAFSNSEQETNEIEDRQDDYETD